VRNGDRNPTSCSSIWFPSVGFPVPSFLFSVLLVHYLSLLLSSITLDPRPSTLDQPVRSNLPGYRPIRSSVKSYVWLHSDPHSCPGSCIICPIPIPNSVYSVPTPYSITLYLSTLSFRSASSFDRVPFSLQASAFAISTICPELQRSDPLDSSFNLYLIRSFFSPRPWLACSHWGPLLISFLFFFFSIPFSPSLPFSSLFA
jgi:hypothetical protein